MTIHFQNKTLAPSFPWLIVCLCLGWTVSNISILGFIFEFSLAWIFPVGTVGFGFGAAFVCYLIYDALNRKPSWNWIVSTILGSFVAVYSYNYFEYGEWYDPALLEICRSRFCEQSIQNPFLGWIVTLTEYIGFAAGSAVILHDLATKLYCDKCGKFFASSFEEDRYSFDKGDFNHQLAKFKDFIESNHFVDALRYFSKTFGQVELGKHKIKTTLKMEKCPSCSIHRLSLVSLIRKEEKDGDISWSSPKTDDFEGKFEKWIDSDYDISEFEREAKKDGI